MSRDETSRNKLVTISKWAGAVLGLFYLVVMFAPSILLDVFVPSVRELVIQRLEERFDDVRLAKLELRASSGLSLIPKFTAAGEGLSVSLPDRADAPPFISMGRFSVELDALGIFREPIRIRTLSIDRLEIQIPPGRDDDEHAAGRDSKESRPPAFVIDELDADGTLLRILRKANAPNRDAAPVAAGGELHERQKEALEYELHELKVESAGLGEPMVFDAVLENAKPPGQVRTTGSFGPLDLSNVGASPVSGQYVFERAKLGDFGGIAGTLYSEGELAGVLSRIEVAGFTETPDFQLSSAAHPISLRTDFKATVDGTNGDTFLTPVNAILGQSRIETQGGVFNRPGTDGKTICLDAAGPDGRIEDYLYLAMDSEPPIMTGDIDFRSLILIPSGDAKVIEKLVLDGEFLIAAARFPDPAIQEKVDTLSEVGRSGDNDGSNSAVDALRDERVLSDIRGEFELRGGVLTLKALSFTVPGASVSLEGTYGLTTKEIDFRGELRLDAKLSETTDDGFRSFLLKLINPLFEKDDAGAVVPIKIGGTPDGPSFGPDLGRVFTREDVTEPLTDRGKNRFHKTIPTCEEVLSGSGIGEFLDAPPSSTSD